MYLSLPYLNNDPVYGLAGLVLGSEHREHGRILSRLRDQTEYPVQNEHKSLCVQYSWKIEDDHIVCLSVHVNLYECNLKGLFIDFTWEVQRF